MDYDPTDPDAVADRERRGAVRQTRDRADLRALLDRPEGRRWVWRVLEHGGAFHTSYDPDSPLRMAFAEGRRSIGLWLLAELQAAAPGEFAALISESYAASQLPTTDEETD
jgi:hypothetical protein